MVKKLISNLLLKAGYQFSRVNNLERKINQGEYKWLQEFEINTVFDVGANIGSFAKMIHKIIPKAEIYAFEPLKDCYDILLGNTKEINLIKCFNLALGNQNGEAVIHRNQFSPSSSLLKMNTLHKNAFPHTQNSVEDTIKISTLDEIVGSMKLKKKVLLKIDVQGFELEVLRGSESFLEDVDLIIVETSFDYLYHNQPLFDSVYKFLTNKEFCFEGNLGQFKDTRNGKILQGDAIFVKH